MEKDYSLLRPFDLVAAKAGALLTVTDPVYGGVGRWVYVAGPDASGRVVTKGAETGKFTAPQRAEAFYMAPLCWIEGRPVYKGSVLYSSFFAECDKLFAPYRHGRFIVTGLSSGQHLMADLICLGATTREENCTWAPPSAP